MSHNAPTWVRERPILFSAPMVRAILDGSKTQTRRIVKPRNDLAFGVPLAAHELAGEVNGGDFMNSPFGQPGDRLWVRETFCMDDNGHEEWPIYKADGIALPVRPKGCGVSRWRPSIHMPRWASRLTLEITGVRIERLNSISAQDAIAEGIEQVDELHGHPLWREYGNEPWNSSMPEYSFQTLWNSITGPSSWDANPWVWVIEFKRVDGAKGA